MFALHTYVSEWHNGTTRDLQLNRSTMRTQIRRKHTLKLLRTHQSHPTAFLFCFCGIERARLQASCSHPSWPSKPPPCSPIGPSRVWTKPCVLAHLLIIKGSVRTLIRSLTHIRTRMPALPQGYILLLFISPQCSAEHTHTHTHIRS